MPLMDWTTPFYLLVALLLVLLNSFFVLAEFALVKVRATRVEELASAGDRRAKVACGMVAHLDAYLSATQLGITVASLGLGWIGEPAFSGLIDALIGLPGWWSPGTSHAASLTTAFIIITFLHILIGELAPKSLAIRRPERSALAIAYPMRCAYFVFWLPMRVLNGASNWLLRRMGLEVQHEEAAHSQHELRMLLADLPPTDDLSLNRLLVLENILDLGRQRVRDVMLPWPRVQHLLRSAGRDEVLRRVAEHRYSRWPVLEPGSGKAVGYLLAKDLLTLGPLDGDWQRLIRPLRTVRPQDNLEATMLQLQREGTNMAIVAERGTPVGLVALEDILEEIVGRIEDEYPRLPKIFLKDALKPGAVSLDFVAQTPEEAIRMLAALIPSGSTPPGTDIAALAVAREREVPTDLGYGVAVPHARCPTLKSPVLVFGRTAEGVVFNPRSAEPVRLIFLLVTPAEQPNLQVFCLGQLASLAHSESVRERLLRAETPVEVIEIVAAADPAVTG
jgi:CBS domain containing-hemolysin-like protein